MSHATQAASRMKCTQSCTFILRVRHYQLRHTITHLFLLKELFKLVAKRRVCSFLLLFILVFCFINFFVCFVFVHILWRSQNQETLQSKNFMSNNLYQLTYINCHARRQKLHALNTYFLFVISNIQNCCLENMHQLLTSMTRFQQLTKA